MIALGSRAFAGPFLLPFWSAPSRGGLYAVMVPGWRLLTFRALAFGEAERFAPEALRAHPRYADWVGLAGTPWNLYVATLDLPQASPQERQAALREVARQYRPEFSAIEER